AAHDAGTNSPYGGDLGRRKEQTSGRCNRRLDGGRSLLAADLAARERGRLRGRPWWAAKLGPSGVPLQPAGLGYLGDKPSQRTYVTVAVPNNTRNGPTSQEWSRETERCHITYSPCESMSSLIGPR